MDAKGNPYPGALVALVPDISRRGRLGLYSAIPTDQNGRFSFSNVAPGSYRIFGWEDTPVGAYQDADYVRRFEDRGKQVVVQHVCLQAPPFPIQSLPDPIFSLRLRRSFHKTPTVTFGTDFSQR